MLLNFLDIFMSYVYSFASLYDEHFVKLVEDYSCFR